MTTRIDEIAHNIHRISTHVLFGPPGGITHNQFLLLGEQPLLFHTGLRSLFAAVRDAVATVLPVRKRFLDASLNCIRQGAPWMPVGYTVAMAESWNTDHADLLALIASHREGGRRFEPWASSDMAMVLSESRAGALEIYVQT